MVDASPVSIMRVKSTTTATQPVEAEYTKDVNTTLNNSQLDSFGINVMKSNSTDATMKQTTYSNGFETTKTGEISKVDFSNITWYGNPLNEFHNPTYHFKVVACKEPCPTTYGDYLAIGKTTIMESGGTKYNITGVTIDNLCGPNIKSQSSSATSIKISVTEPLGVSLLDTLLATAGALGIHNYAKIHYFLELSFLGYDDDGNIVNNVGFTQGAGGDTSDRFKYNFLLYSFVINNIDMQINEGGSIYELTCVPMNEVAFNNDIFRFASPIITTGGTVEENTKQLTNSLNEDVTKRYWGISLIKYDIIIVDKDISGAQIQADDRTKQVRSDDNQSGAGRTIAQYIEQIIMNSTYASTYEKKANNPDAKIMDLIKIYTTVKYGEYNELIQEYCKEVTYYVYLYTTAIPIASTAHGQVMQENKDQIFSDLAKSHYITKRYDYIYTGLNSEVLHFDIKTNLSWAAVVPVFNGIVGSYATAAVGQVVNEDIRSQLASIGQLYSTIANTYKAYLKSKGIDVTSDPTNLQDTQAASMLINYQQALKLQNENASFSTNNPEDVQKKIVQASDFAKTSSKLLNESRNIDSSRISSGALQKFAEDNTPPKAASIPVSYHTNSRDTSSEYGSGNYGAGSSAKSVMASLLDQSYGTVLSGLQNISLDIRGDPYWLGITNMDVPAKTSTSTTINYPSYQLGDHCLLLTFKYPTGIDDTGTPIFQQQDSIFNGIYAVNKVTNSFESGHFKQTLSAYRIPCLIDLKVS